MTGQFSIEEYVRFATGARLVAYTEQGTTQATTLQGPIWQAFADGKFYVLNGVGDGGSPSSTFTGFTWQPGVWYKIDVTGNVATQTWSFAVNDVPYAPSSPLGYRGSPTYLDEVRYLSEGSGTMFLDSVTIVPEPSGVMIALIGGVLIMATLATRRLTAG
jgi:hypothetical protein